MRFRTIELSALEVREIASGWMAGQRVVRGYRFARTNDGVSLSVSHEVSGFLPNGSAIGCWSRFGPGDRTNADPLHVTGNCYAEHLAGTRRFSDS